MRYVEELFDKFVSGIPSIVSAVIFLVIAYAAALLAKALVMKALKLSKIDKKIDKLGIVDETTGAPWILSVSCFCHSLFIVFTWGIK